VTDRSEGSPAPPGGNEGASSGLARSGHGEPPDRAIQPGPGPADEHVRMFSNDDPADPDRQVERNQRTSTDDEYLPVSAVARAFHVSSKTVARWADEGRIPHIVTLGGHRRFPRRAIDHLVEEMRRGR